MKRFGFFSSLAVGSVLLMATTAYGQLSGAIFTTTVSGSTVNGNIYQNIGDVYLNGGPQNMNSAGLPNGIYYYQVTDPNGSLLLSTDYAVCRELTVANNVVSGPIDNSSSGCPTAAHVAGTFNAANQSTPVQLAPFNPTDNPGGEYKVWLIPIGSAAIGPDNVSLSFSNRDAKTDNFKVLCTTSGGCGGNTNPPSITGFKWYDANANGKYDSGEPLIPNWRINLTDQGTNSSFFTFTDNTGNYNIQADSNNTYTVAEVLPPNSTWMVTGCLDTLAQTGSSTQSGGASTTCNSNTSATVLTGTTTPTILGPDFGNVCLGGGGGLTLGFWSNRNGQAILNGDGGWPAFLTGLNLRNANGSNFDPTSYTGFRTWLLNATATNMSYMLSAQLATMELNVRENKVNGSVMVYAPGANTANSLGFVSINDLMAEANTDLGTNGLVLSGNSDRAHQQALETALDQANNNMNFVQPGPASCPFTSPY